MRNIIIVPYDEKWAIEFEKIKSELLTALNDSVISIEHVGSTSVAGLWAKPVIDIQISVAAFEPLAVYRLPLERLGYVFRADNTERTKRYFREAPGARRTHIHVRQVGSFSEQFALLFRDFLRTHPEVAAQYGELKSKLAQHYQGVEERHAYTEAKGPFIWNVMAQADRWAQQTGWMPGSSDA